MYIANSDKPVSFYNLDVIISVGYRVKSKEGTQFRIWANKIIKDYIIKGYSINQRRLEEKGYQELENTLNLFKKTLKTGNLNQDEALGLLDIITNYTNTWLLLQNYDEDNLIEAGKTQNLDYKLDAKESFESLLELKQNLKDKNEATELFAHPREVDGLEGIFGNVYQTFGGIDLYKSVEQKIIYFLTTTEIKKSNLVRFEPLFYSIIRH